MRNLFLAGVVCLLTVTAQAEEVKIYPNAKIDAKSMELIAQMMKNVDPETKAAMGEQQIYQTPDAFAKVYDFYKKFYKETDVKMKKTKKILPNNQVLNEAYFCLDKADSIASSKFWLKIQNPFLGATRKNGRTEEYTKNVTVITIVEKK